VALSRRPEIVNAPGQDPRAAKVPGTDDDDQETMLLAPLVCADRLLGVLVLYKLGTGPFRPVDLGIIDVFSTNAAIAIANAHLFNTVHEERTRLGTMVEHMQEGVVFADPAGTVLLANGAALRLVEADGPAEGAAVADLLAGPGFEPVRAARERVRAGETVHLTGEFHHGSRSHLFSVSAVHGEGERSGGEVLLFRDISDLRSIEAQLVESNKMSAVGQLAAGVAHEFNNLIASVFGYAQLLRVNREPAMLDKGLDVILQSSRRAQELTNGLLTFSRRPDGTREPVDLADLVERTLVLLRRQLDKSEIRVETDLVDLPRVTGDAAGLQQVFLNLLINAQQAVGQEGTIRITGRRRDAQVDVVVEDSGGGIPPEHLDRVFEPFFTTKGALGASSTPGVGLGLTTAYNVIQGHGGTLRAENLPGGARFVVSLPAKAAPAAGETPVPSTPGTDSWILLMEGEAESRTAIEGVLRASGHHPRAVEGAEKALEALGDTAPDLAVLDRLPGLGLKSPYALLRDRMPDLPILFVVDRQQAEEFTGLSDPWVFLLRKPFRSRDLASLVDRILGRRLDAAS
jgi:signal transduction histidine kinase/CheY-like chemotaxis protein